LVMLYSRVTDSIEGVPGGNSYARKTPWLMRPDMYNQKARTRKMQWRAAVKATAHLSTRRATCASPLC